MCLTIIMVIPKGVLLLQVSAYIFLPTMYLGYWFVLRIPLPLPRYLQNFVIVLAEQKKRWPPNLKKYQSAINLLDSISV